MSGLVVQCHSVLRWGVYTFHDTTLQILGKVDRSVMGLNKEKQICLIIVSITFPFDKTKRIKLKEG